MHKTSVTNQRGMLFVMSLVVAFTLASFCSVSLLRSFHETRTSERSITSQRALGLAEASVDATMWKLHLGDFTNLGAAAMQGGTYWAEVSALGGPLQYKINAHGLEQSAQRNLEVVTRLTPASVFQYAMFGDQKINIVGHITTDSYDSSVASYDAATAGQHGDVGTNFSAAGGVTISGSVTVNGQVAVGPGAAADPSAVVTINGGTATITGNPPIIAQPVAMPMPSVVVPAGLPCADLAVGGHTTQVLLAAVGQYCFNTLSVNGGATLTADGPVKVYVTGLFYAGAKTTVGIASNPAQFLVLMTATSQGQFDGALEGHTSFYGGLYGPTATIKIAGDSRIFGSVVAGTIKVAAGDAEIHYDEALGALTNPLSFYRVRVSSWREP